jgi:hypothetical protein
VKELTESDFVTLWPELRRWLPVNVTEVWMIGSASVAVVNPDLPAALRTSKDIDLIPIGTPVLYVDSNIMERELGEDSDFSIKHRFFVDYVGENLLKWTPPGWRQRVTTIQLTEGLRGHCLDPHDVTYNKLYAGRPKDIVWIRGLLKTGLITWARLEELHAGNSLAAADREKVDQSILKVKEAE